MAHLSVCGSFFFKEFLTLDIDFCVFLCDCCVIFFSKQRLAPVCDEIHPIHPWTVGHASVVHPLIDSCGANIIIID